VPEFQHAAEQAPFDTVVGPVHTQFGYHVVVVSRWDPSAASDPNVRQTLQRAASDLVAARLKSMHVWVDPRFGSWGLHTIQGQQAYTVQAPPVPAPRAAREPR
jgi:hypothetical protein